VLILIEHLWNNVKKLKYSVKSNESANPRENFTVVRREKPKADTQCCSSFSMQKIEQDKKKKTTRGWFITYCSNEYVMFWLIIESDMYCEMCLLKLSLFVFLQRKFTCWMYSTMFSKAFSLVEVSFLNVLFHIWHSKRLCQRVLVSFLEFKLWFTLRLQIWMNQHNVGLSVSSYCISPCGRLIRTRKCSPKRTDDYYKPREVLENLSQESDYTLICMIYCSRKSLNEYSPVDLSVQNQSWRANAPQSLAPTCFNTPAWKFLVCPERPWLVGSALFSWGWSWTGHWPSSGRIGHPWPKPSSSSASPPLSPFSPQAPHAWYFPLISSAVFKSKNVLFDHLLMPVNQTSTLCPEYYVPIKKRAWLVSCCYDCKPAWFTGLL